MQTFSCSRLVRRVRDTARRPSLVLLLILIQAFYFQFVPSQLAHGQNEAQTTPPSNNINLTPQIFLPIVSSHNSLEQSNLRKSEEPITNEESHPVESQQSLDSITATSIAPNNNWPFFGYDQANTNFNPQERQINASTVQYLRREWETFNDDALVPGGPPSGFVLESVLGLVYPSSVVGVTASPLIEGNTLYYVDQLGTVFARNARKGTITNPNRHWTTTLVDPDFDNDPNPVLPELIYTAPVLTDDYIWIVGSAYGRLHAIKRKGGQGGQEVDFNPSTPEIDPLTLITDMPFSSVLGDSVIVEDGGKTLFITGINVILNDALVQGEEVGVQIAFDISNPLSPVEEWRTFSVDIDPATGMRYGSGVSVGAGLSVDTNLGYIFGGTGQNTTLPYPEYPDESFAPSGYVDRSDSLYAIDYSTGDFVWLNQFHEGDLFNLNNPVGTGPNNPDGPRDADVLSPPVLYSVGNKKYASVGSKGGIYRAVDRQTGATIWTRQISKRTGIGGIQSGGAFANGVLYVAGFEGIDDGFSDAQFGSATVIGNFANAFFATFSPSFWADVEDTAPDGDPSTGMRIKIYALNPKTGASLWNVGGNDFVELLAGATLRHLSVANDVVFVTTTSGQIFALDAADGSILFSDQSPDLNAELGLGLSKPHHAGMNSGVVVAKAMVYAPFGHQNNPSGGLYAYELNYAPKAKKDTVWISSASSVTIKPTENDTDRNDDILEIVEVAGQPINVTDGLPDTLWIPEGELTVYSIGDSAIWPLQPVIIFTPNTPVTNRVRFDYTIEDLAPMRVLNGQTLNESNLTHTPRRDSNRIVVLP